MSGDNGYTPATPGDFFCPTGGKWYACETGTKFVGCCLSDPCKNGCFADQLKPAGVSTTIYNQYPGGSCGGNTDFWTCLSAPTFWGCCNSDPCMNNSTCATGDLEPTFMDRPDQLEYFGALNVLLSSTVSTTGTPSTALSSTASSGTTSAQSSTTADPAANTSSSSKPSGALIGGVVGGVVALIAIVAGIVFLLCRRKRRKAKANNDELAQSATMTAHPEKGFVAGAYSPQGTAQSPPPTYAYNHSGYSEPQELFAGPVEPASNANRRSELQGHDASYRISELSPVTVGPRELETPETSPRLPQEEFGSSQAKQEALTGLGLTDVPQQGHR